MATKTFKVVFDELIKEEETKRKDNNYLTNVLLPQSASLLKYLMKLEYLLPKEANQQDKNHWKGEVYSVLKSMITDLGFIKSEQLLLDTMNSSIVNGHKLILSELKLKYYSLLNPKDYTIEMTEKLAQKYFPIVSKWLYNSYKDVVRKRIEPEECAHNFIDELFK
jgi:hypothetical protein